MTDIKEEVILPVNGTVDPIEFEKQCIQEQIQDTFNPEDAQETAARLFALLIPRYNEGVDKLSSRAKTRALKALAGYPLVRTSYNHMTQDEKDLVAIGGAINEAKFVLIMGEFNERLDGMIQKAAQDCLTEKEKAASVPTVETTEESNG